jgi:hypothetical protein
MELEYLFGQSMQPLKTPRQMLFEEAGILPKFKTGGKSKPAAKSPRVTQKPKKVKK